MRKLRRFKPCSSLRLLHRSIDIGPRSASLSEQLSPLGAYRASKRLLVAAERRAARIVETEVLAARERAYANAGREALSVIAEASRFRERLIESAREDALKIVLEIAAEILGEALIAQPLSLNSRIKRAFEKLKFSGTCCIRVNPLESEQVATFISSRDAEGTTTSNVTLIPDLCVRPGSARIESKSATIVLDPRVHLQNVCDRLAEVSRHHMNEKQDPTSC